VIMGIIAWIGCALRYPQIFAFALGKQGNECNVVGETMPR
jgi:hypothetical protein